MVPFGLPHLPLVDTCLTVPRIFPALEKCASPQWCFAREKCTSAIVPAPKPIFLLEKCAFLSRKSQSFFQGRSARCVWLGDLRWFRMVALEKCFGGGTNCHLSFVTVYWQMAMTV